MSELGKRLATLGLRHSAAHFDAVVAIATKAALEFRSAPGASRRERTAGAHPSQPRTPATPEPRRPLHPDDRLRLGLAQAHRSPTVEAVLQLDFLGSARNVLIGPQGLGKTMMTHSVSTDLRKRGILNIPENLA